MTALTAPVEVTLERIAAPRRRRGRPYDDDCAVDGDVAVVRLGDRLATVETTFSKSDRVTNSWLQNLRPPLSLIVGLVALRGSAPGQGRHAVPGRFNPRRRDNPIRCVALCVGGSHALVYRPYCCDHKYTKGPLAFDNDEMAQLRALLGDGGVTVACVGAREARDKLATEWGLHVARPVELTDLFARAYGIAVTPVEAPKKAPKKKVPKKAPKKAPKEAPKKAPKKLKSYRVLSSKEFRRAIDKEKAEAEAEAIEKEYREQSQRKGTTPAEVVRGLDLEHMATVALGLGRRWAPLPRLIIPQWPQRVADADCGARGRCLTEEEWMYCTRDAYLCFEIANCYL